MTSGGDDVTLLPLAEVQRRCEDETKRYRDHVASDSRFCLEIFRRAIKHAPSREKLNTVVFSDEEARSLLVRMYTGFVHAQMNRKALHWCDQEDIVQQTWLRFWKAVPNLQPFLSLEAALFYLKRTAVSAVIEATRQATQRQREESIQALSDEMNGEEQFAGGVNPVTQQEQERVRTRINELLQNQLDRRIFWMRYSFGLPPREIAPRLGEEGVLIRERLPTARAVSDCLERCIRILQEDPEIRDLLQGD